MSWNLLFPKCTVYESCIKHMSNTRVPPPPNPPKDDKVEFSCELDPVSDIFLLNMYFFNERIKLKLI